MQFSHVGMPKVTHVTSQVSEAQCREPTSQKRRAAQRDGSTSPMSRIRCEALRTSQHAAMAAEMKRGKSDSFEKKNALRLLEFSNKVNGTTWDAYIVGSSSFTYGEFGEN